MSASRALCAVMLLSLSAAGCSEEAATAVAAPGHEMAEDLSFRFPDATKETLIHAEVDDAATSTAPAAVIHDGDLAPPPDAAVAKIISALTWVGFSPTYAFSSARQTYTGNHGEITTTATVTFDAKVIGVQPSSRESTMPYLLDAGRSKTLWVDAYVFTDQQCGLKVDGSSLHVASWQWFLGAVANWGKDSETTQAFPPVEQEPCVEENAMDGPGTGTGGGSGDSGSGGLVSCWYVVTFDLKTGEVVDARFLYCDDVLEGG